MKKRMMLALAVLALIAGSAYAQGTIKIGGIWTLADITGQQGSAAAEGFHGIALCFKQFGQITQDAFFVIADQDTGHELMPLRANMRILDKMIQFGTIVHRKNVRLCRKRPVLKR